jgi:CRISPR/Cas system Type II protein with McrA/HNH and RuvC-like nuclease domain
MDRLTPRLTPTESLKLWSVYCRDNGHCWYCELPVPRRTHEQKLRATRDHVIPLSKNGPTSLENLRLAHQYCNTARMGLYQRPKNEIVTTIASLLTPTQIRVAQEDLEQARAKMERIQSRRARDAEFRQRRLAVQ